MVSTTTLLAIQILFNIVFLFLIFVYKENSKQQAQQPFDMRAVIYSTVLSTILSELGFKASLAIIKEVRKLLQSLSDRVSISIRSD